MGTGGGTAQERHECIGAPSALGVRVRVRVRTTSKHVDLLTLLALARSLTVGRVGARSPEACITITPTAYRPDRLALARSPPQPSHGPYTCDIRHPYALRACVRAWYMIPHTPYAWSTYRPVACATIVA